MAIHGAVELGDDGLEPKVSLTVLNFSGDALDVRAVVDTGFTGDLTLPEEHIRELGYRYEATIGGTLAGEREVQVDLYEGRVLWHGEERDVTVAAADGDPLVGMELLSGSRLTMEATPGGDVLIEEL